MHQRALKEILVSGSGWKNCSQAGAEFQVSSNWLLLLYQSEIDSLVAWIVNKTHRKWSAVVFMKCTWFEVNTAKLFKLFLEAMIQFGASLCILRLPLKNKSSPFTKMRTGPPTYARGHSGNELKGRCTSTLSFSSSLHKRVGQKGAEAVRKVRKMSETLPTL